MELFCGHHQPYSVYTRKQKHNPILWILKLLGLSLMLCSYNLNTQAVDNNRVQKLSSSATRYKSVGLSRLLTCCFCCCCCSSGSSFCSSCCLSLFLFFLLPIPNRFKTNRSHVFFGDFVFFRILHLKTSTERQKLGGKWVQLDHSCRNLNHLKWRISGFSRCFDQRFDHLGVNLILLHNSTPRATPHTNVR